MHSSLIKIASIPAVLESISPGNLVYIIPDGLSPASITVVRTYEAMVSGQTTPEQPLVDSIFIDQLPVGNVRTYSAHGLVMDSSAAGIALATGLRPAMVCLGLIPMSHS
jgi:alkaline phosphatase